MSRRFSTAFAVATLAATASLGLLPLDTGPAGRLLNDVDVTRDGVFVTDSPNADG